jgi:hypothetical protein
LNDQTIGNCAAIAFGLISDQLGIIFALLAASQCNATARSEGDEIDLQNSENPSLNASFLRHAAQIGTGPRQH